MPNKIGSFSSGATTSMVVKNRTKKTFEIFFSSIHASRKLLYSLHFSTYMKMVNSTHFYRSGTTTFTHKVLISTTFVKQSFDLKMTCFHHWHPTPPHPTPPQRPLCVGLEDGRCWGGMGKVERGCEGWREDVWGKDGVGEVMGEFPCLSDIYYLS